MNTINKIEIGVDCDDIILKCVGELSSYLREKYNLNYTAEELSVWGHTGDDRDKKFEAFSDPEFVSTQPLYKGAKGFINELRKRGHVTFVTAVNSAVYNERAAMLIDIFGAHPSDIIMASQKDKVHLDFLIDDSPRNIRNSNCTHSIQLCQPEMLGNKLSGALSATCYKDVITIIDYILDNRKPTKIAKNPIICLVGPTGTQKTEIAKALCEQKKFSTIDVITTSTSRNRKSMTIEDFKKNLNIFAEYTVYGGHFYGIKKETIENISDKDKIVIPIDICGAMALKSIFGERCVSVFCQADRLQCFKNTLARTDLTDDEKAIRLAGIDDEFANSQYCDFITYGVEDTLQSF